MMKLVGVFLLVSIGFLTLFYFYPAAIFEADIIENGMYYSTDITLKSFFDHKALPSTIYSDKISSVVPSWKGWVLLFICIIGLPMMIAYRVGIVNTPEEEEVESN